MASWRRDRILNGTVMTGWQRPGQPYTTRGHSVQRWKRLPTELGTKASPKRRDIAC